MIGKTGRRVGVVVVCLGLVLGWRIGVAPIRAQDGGATCPAIVQEALARASEACGGALNRNTACYGNTAITATGWDAAPLEAFAAPGDRLNVADLAALITAPLDEAAGEWGVAVMALQADLLDSLPGQSVTFVVFGDTVLRNAVEPLDTAAGAAVTCPGQLGTGLNVRAAPTTSAAIIGGLAAGDEVTITGRFVGGGWYRIDYAGDEGWIFAPPVTLRCDAEPPAAIPGTDAAALAPMQAFSLSSGLGAPVCAEAPRDGVLVQAPQDTTVHFLVNGIEVEVGSTAYLSQAVGAGFEISTLAGTVNVTSGGATETVPAGLWTTVAADTAPAAPTSFSGARAQELAALPFDLLPEPVGIPITAPGNAVWFDSNIPVRAGQVYTITATGGVNPCLDESGGEYCIFYDPAGVGSVAAPNEYGEFPLYGAPFMGLLTRIGAEGEVFYVGAAQTFTAEADGVLYFAVNDNTRADNQGEHVVTIWPGLTLDDLPDLPEE